jgi:hypothetical protein
MLMLTLLACAMRKTIAGHPQALCVADREGGVISAVGTLQLNMQEVA